MKEWSDEELDKLFRKSAEEFEPKYQPNDWQDLRSRLDEADGVTGGGWLKSAAPWLVGALLLLLTGAGIYYFVDETNSSYREKNTVLPPVTKVPDNSAIITKSPTEADSPQAEIFSDPGQERNTSSRVNDRYKERLENSPNRRVNETGKELPRNPASVSGVRKPTDPIRESGDGAILLSKKQLRLSPALDTDGVDPKSETSSDNPGDAFFQTPDSKKGETLSDKNRMETAGSPDLGNFKDSQLREQWPNPERLPTRDAVFKIGSLSFPAVTYAENSGRVPTTTSEKATSQIPKWSVRIGFSPDLSMVDMSEMKQSMKVGPSASLLVDYNISDRWALQTGVIRSLKNYNAPGGEYKWPDSWKKKQMPEPNSVDGSCQVFEIPLNFRFDISQKPRGRWFAGAGVSSYKMQKEDYIYNYENYDPKNMDPWETKSDWAFLSHANISMGYEHRITKRLSILAEPYAKIPLRGVGHGKVNLFTTGIWFSARYTPLFRNQKSK